MLGQGVAALIPIYQPNIGNGTKVVTEAGEDYVDGRTMRSVVKLLCKYYTIHVEYCREKYGRIINQRISVPLPIHEGLLLIPFKMRKPISSKDGACGYINLYAIQDLGEAEEGAMVILKNGLEVHCLHRLKTVQQHINNAKLIAKDTFHYKNVGYESEAFQEFCEAYHAPATKADIAMLKKEVLELIKVLENALVKK